MFSVRPLKPYKKWQDLKEGQPAEPQFGILSKLVGTWSNWEGGPTGLHTTPMPSPGTSSETIFGVFHFKSQEYKETLTFTKVDEPVRNRGGSNEQFNGAVKYETIIHDNSGKVQHFENGMYLWLGDNEMPWRDESPYQNPSTMYSYISTKDSVTTDGGYPVMKEKGGELGSQFVPPYSISRQGVIPHGTTIHLTGNVTKSCSKDTGVEAPHIADIWEKQYLSVSPTMGINLSEDSVIGPDLIPGQLVKPEWTKDPREKQKPNGFNSGRAYFLSIFNYDNGEDGAKFPYTVQPNLKLKDANKGLKFKGYDLIELDTFHPTGIQGGAINNVMIERYCRVVRVRMRMWIEQICEGDEIIDQLQYEQIVYFEFMFSSDGTTTQWPHIQVNTLRRKSKDNQAISHEKKLPSTEMARSTGAKKRRVEIL